MHEFFKVFILLSFVLNIACGVWVFFGILQWIRELKHKTR